MVKIINQHYKKILSITINHFSISDIYMPLGDTLHGKTGQKTRDTLHGKTGQETKRPPAPDYLA
jgi:hypothetical protein